MSSRYSYPHEDQYKFTFGTDAGGTPTTVARMYEVDHGRLKAERIGRNDSFSVEVDPATGKVVEVEQTRLGAYSTHRGHQFHAIAGSNSTHRGQAGVPTV